MVDFSGAKNLIVNDLILQDKTMNEIVVKNLPGFEHVSSSPNVIHLNETRRQLDSEVYNFIFFLIFQEFYESIEYQ